MAKEYFEIECYLRLAIPHGHIPLEQAVEKLDEFKGTLQELIENAPDPDNLGVETRNHESSLLYKRKILNPEDVSTGARMLEYLKERSELLEISPLTVNFPKNYRNLIAPTLEKYNVS